MVFLKNKQTNEQVCLCAECERLQQDLLNVERLEGKVQAEMNSLKEKIQEMTEGLKTYRDLDTLKASGEQRMKVAVFILKSTTHQKPFSHNDPR